MDNTIPFNSQGVVVNGPGGPALASLGIPPAPAITVPGVKKTSVVTSEPAATATKNNSEFLNQIGSQLNIAQEKALQIKATLDAMTKKEEADKLASTKPQSEVDKLIGEVGGVSTGNIQQPDFKSQAILDNEVKLTNEKAELAKLRITMDSRSSSIIQNIEREYDSLIEEQRQINKAFEGGVTTEGFRSGRSRYAPVLQSGIINSTINSGIKALSNLQVKKQGLILQAENARDERNFKLLNDSIQEYREAVKEERNIAQKTYENAINASEEAREQLKFEQGQAEKTAEEILPFVFGLMTGDDEADQATILDLSNQYKIDPNVLSSKLLEYQGTVNAAQNKDLPTIIREYEEAKNRGYFNGSFIEYQKLFGKGSTKSPTSKVLDARTAVALGIPELQGVDENTLILSLGGSVPPQWFIDLTENKYQQNLLPNVIQEEWAKFKEQPEVKTYIAPIKRNIGDTTSFGALSGLNIPEPVQ